jgi:hypothetical protein
MLDPQAFEIATKVASEIRSTDEDSGYALPVGSLDFLREVVKRCGIRRVFEFGSGQSTRVFLEAGISVTTLENDSRWLEATKESFDSDLRNQWTARCEPLQLICDGISPFYSWKIVESVLYAILNADLVLIDSPAHPPSREMALLQTLRSGCRGLIIVDDLRVPTLQRRVQDIASGNSTIQYRFLDREHGLGLLQSQQQDRRVVKSSRSIFETMKTFRRYLHARRGV